MSVEIKGSGSFARGSSVGTIARGGSQGHSPERSTGISSYKPMLSISKEGSISKIGSQKTSGPKLVSYRVEQSRFSRDTKAPTGSLKNLKVEARSPFMTAMQSRAEVKAKPTEEAVKIKVNNRTTKPYELAGLPSLDRRVAAPPKAQSVFLYQRRPEGITVKELPKTPDYVTQPKPEPKRPALPQLRINVLPSSDYPTAVPRRSETAFLYLKPKVETPQMRQQEGKRTEVKPTIYAHVALNPNPELKVPKREAQQALTKQINKQPIIVNRRTLSDWEGRQAAYVAKKAALAAPREKMQNASKIEPHHEGKVISPSVFVQKLAEKTRQMPSKVETKVTPILAQSKDIQKLQRRVESLRLQLMPKVAESGQEVSLGSPRTAFPEVAKNENISAPSAIARAEQINRPQVIPEQAKLELQTKLQNGVIVVHRMTEVMVSHGTDFGTAHETALSRVSLTIAQTVQARELDKYLVPHVDTQSGQEKAQVLKTYEQPQLVYFQKPGAEVQTMTDIHLRRMIATMAQTMPAEQIHQELRNYQTYPLSVEEINGIAKEEKPIQQLVGAQPATMIIELCVCYPSCTEGIVRRWKLFEQVLNEEQEGVTKRLIYDENEGYLIECERIVAERDPEADVNRIRTAVQVGSEALTEATKAGQTVISSRVVALRMPTEPGPALVSFIRKQLELMLDSEAQYDAFTNALGSYGQVASLNDIERAAKYATDQAPAVRLTKVVTTEEVKPIDEERAVSNGRGYTLRAA